MKKTKSCICILLFLLSVTITYAQNFNEDFQNLITNLKQSNTIQADIEIIVLNNSDTLTKTKAIFIKNGDVYYQETAPLAILKTSNFNLIVDKLGKIINYDTTTINSDFVWNYFDFNEYLNNMDTIIFKGFKNDKKHYYIRTNELKYNEVNILLSNDRLEQVSYTQIDPMNNSFAYDVIIDYIWHKDILLDKKKFDVTHYVNLDNDDIIVSHNYKNYKINIVEGNKELNNLKK